MEKARLIGLNAGVEEEDKRRLIRLSNAKCRGWGNIVGSVKLFRTTLPVKSFAKLIDLAEVIRGHFVFEMTQVALCLAALLKPREVRIDVCLAARAAERTFFTKVNERHFPCALSVIVLRRLCQRLYHDAERDFTLLLHFVI